MLQKVLVVDDDERNIFALVAVLKAKGFSCLTANSAVEGLRILADEQDVVIALIDMMMPEMDGYEMLARIRASEKGRLPVIAVTAQAMAGDREKCLAAGADDYIAKPINIDGLMDVLSKYHVGSKYSIGR